MGNETNIPTQTVHKQYINSYNEQVSAVIEDVWYGSAKKITEDEAKKMLYGIQSFSGTASRRIRNAYGNPGADKRDIERLHSVDRYIQASPKWKGKIYRGINVTKEQAEKLLSGEPIDMLGPSSWSSDKETAERFSDGYKDIRMVFVLDDNKSGASITHIGTFNGSESEITAPSGIKYKFDGFKKVRKDNSDIIYVQVRE